MTATENFDIILRRYEEIGARLSAGATGGGAYAALSRELAELEPVVGAIRAWRDKEKERADLDALLAEPAARSGNARHRRGRVAPRVEAELERDGAGDPARAAAQGRRRRAQRHTRGARREPAATRRRCSPAICFACTSNTPNRRAGRSRLLSASEGTAGGYKEIVAEIAGRGAFARLKYESGVHRVQRVPATEAQGRIHTSAATVAVLPEAQEVDLRHQRRRPEDRHDALERRRRPACQQDRIGDPHHPPADRHRRRGAGGALAAPQPRQGDGGAALAHPRRREPARQRGARAGAARPGRLGRPLATHPHLQFPAGARHRPSHQPDALQPRSADGGRRPRHDHRRARRRPAGAAARRNRRSDDRAPAALRAGPDDRPARRHLRPAARRPPADLRARLAPPAARPAVVARHPRQPVEGDRRASRRRGRGSRRRGA